MDADVAAGQSIYNPLILRIYDLLVLRFSCSVLWRCPRDEVLQLYNRYVTADHLDVGVGSGFFLDRCTFPTEHPRITLVDLNPNARRYAARRLARYDVATHQANVLEPLGLPAGEYGSASINFLLHCVPGDMTSKAVALSHVAACVKPGGVVFGSTILAHGVPVTSPARFVMDRYNARGIFHNRHDSLAALDAELARRFVRHELHVKGCVGVFVGHVG